MMKRSSVMAAAVCAAVMCTSQVASAGAWTQPEGEHYTKVWMLALVGSAGYDSQGNSVETEDYRLLSMNYYFEYGLSDKWTYVTTGRPFAHAIHGSRATPYVGEMWGGVRRGFLSGPLRLGIEGQVGYQGIARGKNLADEGAGYTFSPAPASGLAKLEGQLGVEFPNGWVSASAGIKSFGNEAISSAVIGGLQVGYTIKQKVTVDLHFPVNVHLEELEQNNLTGAGESNYIGAGVGVSWGARENFALHAAFDGVLFARANLATPALLLGMEFR